jgi:outer membrane protein TolC
MPWFSACELIIEMVIIRTFIFFFLTFLSMQIPAEQVSKPMVLSLRDAIMFAVRDNPNVEVSQLNLIQQKFALTIQQWQFQPHYSLNASLTTNRNIVNGYDPVTGQVKAVQPAASWLSPIGTQVAVSSVNTFTNHFNPGVSVQVTQPLLRGFGRPIVEAALYNAMDSETVSKLNVVATLKTTVSSVINAYLNAVSASNTVKIDQESLARAQLSVKQTKLFIQAGHKAGNELVTVQADVANAQTTLENDKNTVQQSYFALLTAIGLDPNTKIALSTLDVAALIKKYRLPTLEHAKELALANDAQYQTDVLTLQGATKRNLMIAEDSMRPQLNLMLNAGTGSAQGGGRNAGIASLYNGTNQTESASLNLQIPLDDKLAKQGVFNAKIALSEANIALKQEKWSKETNAINAWNSISSAERALQFAANATQLQQKTYQLSYKKYLYGLIDSIELQSVRGQLIATEQGLVSAQLNYLNALVNLDLLQGTTLETWDIKVHFN